MIYLNNAATHHPTPTTVADAVRTAMLAPPVQTHRETGEGEDHLLACRQALAALFGTGDPDRIILAANATDALNLAIHGLLAGSGGHVVTTQAEHNAVLRPLHGLRRAGRIELTVVPAGADGRMDVERLAAACRPDTRLVVANHVSNVTGHGLDVDGLYMHCRNGRGIPLLVDASQSAGALPIDLGDMPGAALAFTGHKGLMGPAGTGGLVVGAELDLAPWKLGGIGIHSEGEEMPAIWPLRFEPGTPNVPAFHGLHVALRALADEGLEKRAARRRELVEALLSYLGSRPGFTVYSPPAAANPCGIVSFRMDGWSCADAGYLLRESFGIHLRTGLHCAPLVHRALGTFPEGTVRVSVSSCNVADDIGGLVAALDAIVRGRGCP